MARWRPKPADYQEAIRTQNPWQQLGSVPAELAPSTKRPLAELLWRALIDPSLPRHQLILGPRRVGKTTVMYQTVAQLLERGIEAGRLWWLRLDHPLLLDRTLGELVEQVIRGANASRQRPVFVFLDELTYAPDWDLWLKTFHDERWPARIVGTSSATAAMRQRGTESGVGRWDEQYLAPYLFTEYLDSANRSVALDAEPTLSATIEKIVAEQIHYSDLAEARRRFLLTGGFPELLLAGTSGLDEASQLLRSQRILRSDAIEKAVYKDLPQAFSIQDPSKLERLLYILAGQMGGLLSPRAVAADLSISAMTVENYLGYLERAFLVFTLPGFSSSEEAVQRRGKKLYFVDGAVRNAALLRGTAPIADRAEMGMLIENMAASHLRALAYQSGVRLYHWREKAQEVDLVYDHPDSPMAFEISIAAKHSRKHLLEFQRKYARFRGHGYLVTDTRELSPPTPQQPGRVSIDAFLVAVGIQARFAMEARMDQSLRSEANPQLLLF